MIVKNERTRHFVSCLTCILFRFRVDQTRDSEDTVNTRVIVNGDNVNEDDERRKIIKKQ